MKRIAILVIAATSQPVYVHYVRTYWSALIRHLRVTRPHIDVFLLFENDTDLGPYTDLSESIIRDPRSDLSAICCPDFHTRIVPGVLSKTLHALEVLQDRYDVFFRTNLSSMIRVPYFDQFVQSAPDIVYSGGSVWRDALRDSLIASGAVGPARSIQSLSELDRYPGNTFASGAGYFLGAADVRRLLRQRDEIRYDIVDDVAMGLMFPACRYLPGFHIEISQRDSIPSILCQIRRSEAPHVKLANFPPEKARRLWAEIDYGQLWQVRTPPEAIRPRYRIHFPLFDHQEGRSNEMRMTVEGLKAHPQVSLVDDPESADYVVLCQNHLVEQCPFHGEFRALKDRFKPRTVLLDYDDNPHQIYDREDFRWALYFKRSCVDRQTGQAVDYGALPIVPTAYGVVDDMVEPPEGLRVPRRIALSCLFEDAVCDYEDVFGKGRAPLLRLARRIAAESTEPMQIGLVSPCGPEGRSGINGRYKQCLFDSRIVLHANPDPWEGDARTWEAIASGALVFVDRMVQPIPYPLVDGEHVVFYDLGEAGFRELEGKIRYYLEHDDERARIGRQGREFVLARHRSVNRIDEVIRHLEARQADRAELVALIDQEQAAQARRDQAFSWSPIGRR